MARLSRVNASITFSTRIARIVGQDLSTQNPILDTRLPMVRVSAW